MNKELKKCKEEGKNVYAKELEITHMNAQLKAKEVELEKLHTRYRKKLKKKQRQFQQQEQDWNKAYQMISSDLQKLKVEIELVRRENVSLKDQCYVSGKYLHASAVDNNKNTHTKYAY